MTPGRDGALEMLGIARRAGQVVAGTRSVLEALGRERLTLVLIAEDAGESALGRVSRVFRAADEVPVYRCGTREELGAAVGKAPLVAVGVTDPSLAGRIEESLERRGRKPEPASG